MHPFFLRQSEVLKLDFDKGWADYTDSMLKWRVENVLVRTVSTFVRFNGGLKEISSIWGKYEWTGSVDELKSRSEEKRRFKMVPTFRAPRIG